MNINDPNLDRSKDVYALTSSYQYGKYFAALALETAFPLVNDQVDRHLAGQDSRPFKIKVS